MCYRCYLATDGLLSSVPMTNPPTFSVALLTVDQVQGLALPFPAGWSVAKVGAHTGCGCGFHSNPDWPWLEERTVDEDEISSRHRLADFINRLMPARVQMFSHWEVDPTPEPSGRLTASAFWIADHWDPLPDGWLVEIDLAAPSPDHPWAEGPIPGKSFYP